MKYDLSQSFDKSKAKLRFEKLLENGSKIELKEYKAKRTRSQNRYLHVVFTIIGQELGYTDHESKVTMKRYFSNTYEWAKYQKGSEWFLKSTSEYDTSEMTTFIEVPFPGERQR